MIVSDMLELLSDLPLDMEIVVEGKDGSLITVCKLQSEVIDVDFEDDDSEQVLLLMPCTCDTSFLGFDNLRVGDINSNQNLN